MANMQDFNIGEQKKSKTINVVDISLYRYFIRNDIFDLPEK